MVLKFELVVDDDPNSQREHWPSKASFRATHAPRCLNGHFLKKSALKRHWPRSAGDDGSWSCFCQACENKKAGSGEQWWR